MRRMFGTTGSNPGGVIMHLASPYGWEGDDLEELWDIQLLVVGICQLTEIETQLLLQVQQFGYNLGGGNSAVGKLHYSSEIMYQVGNSPSGNDHTASCGDENRSWASFRGSRYTSIILTIVGLVGLLTWHLTEFVNHFLLSRVTSIVVLVTMLHHLGLNTVDHLELVLRTELRFVLMVKKT